MKISVVTVSYNSAKTIAHTLDSFAKQNWAERELIVVDGGSTDGTQAIVEKMAASSPAPIRIVSEPDKGLYDAMNKGFALYSGDAIGFLNSDDVLADSSVLSRVARGLKSHQMVYGHLNFVEDHLSKTVKRRWRSTMPPKSGFISGWMPAHPTFYVRREVAESVGRFSLTYRTAADYDWMLRACELAHYDIGLIDHLMIEMMTGGQSTSSLQSYVKHNIEALRVRRSHYQTGIVDYALIAKPLSKLSQFIKRF